MEKQIFCLILIGLSVINYTSAAINRNVIVSPKDEKFRPQLHHSVPENWSNDPNEMVYLDGEYHLYYQYDPIDNTGNGPKHWGHAVSRDMIRWTELPVALYPDELGGIWSGGAVVDFDNSTGFQTGSNIPIVAIFTHSPQMQSIAYSNDNGRTFTKYEGNPVIPNPGDVRDFRDPNVIKYEDKWVMVVAMGEKIQFYDSKDLKAWTLLSEFGQDPQQGHHGATWECPDFLEMKLGDETVWVLLVSSYGGPNGGSGTQYFIGDFDGKKFTSSQMDPLWLDWGLDNYAPVTFYNDPLGRHVLMGWMTNLDYGGSTPTVGWRGQMTLPRALNLRLASGQVRLTSYPVPELENLVNFQIDYLQNVTLLADQVFDLNTEGYTNNNPLLQLTLEFDISLMEEGASIAICFLNSLKQEVCTGYDKGRERPIFTDRELSGTVEVPNFYRRVAAPREISSDRIHFNIILDVSAVEVFVDEGLTVMTTLFYSDEPYTKVEVRHHANGNPNSSIRLAPPSVKSLNPMSS